MPNVYFFTIFFYHLFFFPLFRLNNSIRKVCSRFNVNHLEMDSQTFHKSDGEVVGQVQCNLDGCLSIIRLKLNDNRKMFINTSLAYHFKSSHNLNENTMDIDLSDNLLQTELKPEPNTSAITSEIELGDYTESNVKKELKDSLDITSDDEMLLPVRDLRPQRLLTSSRSKTLKEHEMLVTIIFFLFTSVLNNLITLLFLD